jgi:endoglycosylceramidase
LLAQALLFGALVFAAPAQAGPQLPLGHAGRWITDARGRVVVVHGINMVYKLAPYYPAAVGFGDDDAAFLHSIGFNAVRVGVIWKGLEPQPGGFDDNYLAQIASTVQTLARHGIVSLLDFHQDLYNEQFQGEGAPDWAVQNGGLPNPKLGFPGNYAGNPALEHALDSFWGNAAGPAGVGLETRFAAAWAHVAARFAGDKDVLGYELFNEPFPGTAWEQCATTPGCPAFDSKLATFYHHVDTAIRVFDPNTLVWYEPNVWFNFGDNTNLGALGDPRAGFSFHDYCLVSSSTGCSSEATPFADALAHVSKTHEAVMMTEFGATNQTGVLDGMVTLADQNMVPWLEWAYCGCQDPTTSGPGNKQAIVIDPAKPPTGSNLEQGTLHALVEPYPQLVAGTPTAWGFNRTSNSFKLAFATTRAAGGKPFGTGTVSEIATPSLVYPHGYAVNATGAAIISAPEASELVLAACPGARQISVTTAPSGKITGSCKPRLKVVLSPHHYTAGRRTHFTVTVTEVLGSFRQPVPGAIVKLAGHVGHTGRHGRARITFTPNGKRIAVHVHAGFVYTNG